MDGEWEAAAQVTRGHIESLLAPRGGSQEWATTIESAAALIDSAETLLRTTVQSARADGATWQAIGDALGVTRQAAFQRYGKPLDPRTGEPMNTTPLPDAPKLARTVLDDLAAASWGAVAARFDSAMTQALSADGLAEAWAQITSQVGRLEQCGAPKPARAGDLTITNTPLSFEAGDLTARITFRDDRTIAGLYFLDPQAA